MSDERDGDGTGGSTTGGLLECDGLDQETPYSIAAKASSIGVPQEYAELTRRYGKLGSDWSVDIRSLSTNAAGRTVETFRLTLKGGARVEFHFDVTDFYKT